MSLPYVTENGASADLRKKGGAGVVHTRPIAAAGVDKEEAFRALEDAFEEKSPFLRRLGTDARLDPIKDDPRFKRLVRVLWPQTSPMMVAAGSSQ